MMEEKKKQPISAQSNEKSDDNKLHMTVDGCAVTLNFSSKAQDSTITEIKRMILSGHTRTKV